MQENHHPLVSALASHLDAIHHDVGKMNNGIDSEATHDLRVELKRMRAILRLIHFLRPTWPYRRHYAPFRALFRSAGLLREWQLQVGMLDAVPAINPEFYDAYRTKLLKKLVGAHRHLADVLREDLPAGKSILHTAHSCFEVAGISDYQAYFQFKSEEMHTLLDCGPLAFPERIHPFRKALKDYNNNRRNTINALSFDPGPAKGLPDPSGDLERLLGDWNDFQTALWHLAEAEETAWSEPWTMALADLRGYWSACSETLLSTLYEQTRLEGSGT